LKLFSVNPILPLIVDNQWRKDSFKGIIFYNEDINIYVPESAKNMISN